MHCKWKRLWRRRHDADLTKDRATFSQPQSPSFMSAIYDRTVRTNSYNDFVMKIDVFTGEIRAHNGNADVPFSLHTSGLLEPSQQAVDDILQAQMDVELPEMMDMALEFFENSHIASTLCATLLRSIDEARDQCRRMEVILAGLPHSGEALGCLQQKVVAESLLEMVKAKNPFTENDASEMFADVGKRYGDLSGAVEERRKMVGKKVRVLRRWRGGCITVAVAVVVGATVVAVVVATHMAVTMATVPVVAVAAVARSKSMNGRTSRSTEGELAGESCPTVAGADGMRMESGGLHATTHAGEGEGARGHEEGAVIGKIRPTSGPMRSGMGGIRRGEGGVGTREGGKGAESGRVEVQVGIEMRGIDAEVGGGGITEMGGAGPQRSGIEPGGARTGGGGLEEGSGAGGKTGGGAGGRGVDRGGGGVDRGGVGRARADVGGGEEGARGRAGQQCFGWGLGVLTRQSAKLDALARGSFTVNRMLDTLRCLVTGLQDDVERNRKLVEFGWTHREEAKCVQQVGKQLCRSHSHMVRQLANFQEQVVVCFLIINKARDIVLQEFSPSSPKT